MSEQTDYTDEHVQIGERVKDFLPLPSELIKTSAYCDGSLTLMPSSIYGTYHNNEERPPITNDR